MVTGVVQRYMGKNVSVNLGKVDAILSENEQVKGEVYKPTERIKVYVLEVKDSPKGPKIMVSRTHPELVKRLFEAEVTEVKDGIVEIKSIAREAGSRTKIAVWSNDPDVDAVGACVGMNGARVNTIVEELRGEKIDIISWNENPALLIENALSPAKVITVLADPDEKTALVIVPDYQLSLAIGKEGQNARLAARLTGFKIDIKSETQASIWEVEPKSKGFAYCMIDYYLNIRSQSTSKAPFNMWPHMLKFALTEPTLIYRSKITNDGNIITDVFPSKNNTYSDVLLPLSSYSGSTTISVANIKNVIKKYSPSARVNGLNKEKLLQLLEDIRKTNNITNADLCNKFADEIYLPKIVLKKADIPLSLRSQFIDLR